MKSGGPRLDEWLESTTPDLHGVSGGPVFRVTEDGGETMLNERAKWVGTESGFFLVEGHELIKATGVEIPLSLISTSKPEFRTVIERELAGQVALVRDPPF